MRARHRKLRTMGLMLIPILKGLPIDRERIKDPAILSFLNFFNAVPVRVPSVVIRGAKELRRRFL